MLCKQYRLVCTAIIVVLQKTAWSLIALPLPHFFHSKNRISSLYSSIKKKDMSWVSVQTGTQGVAGCDRKTCMQSFRCTWLVQSHWILKGQRSLRPHAQCNWIFLHILLCTHGKRVWCKEGGDKALRMNFEGKPREDILRPNALCSCRHTCLSMGFRKFASPNLCFQWVLLPRSRKSKQLGYGKMWNSTLGARDKIKLLFSVKLYTGVKLQSIHHGCCMYMLLSCQRKPKEKFLRSQSLCNKCFRFLLCRNLSYPVFMWTLC